MERKYKYSTKNSLATSIVRTPSMVDEFYIETIGTNDDKKPIVRFVDPIYMLFNQERLSHMGAENVQRWLDSLNSAGNREIDELKSKCSDEQLTQMIKSRHLQSPSEILAWCRYMNDNIEEFNAEVQRIAQQQVTEQTSVESPKASE